MDQNQINNTLFFFKEIEKEEYGALLKEVYISDRTTNKSTTYEQDADVRKLIDAFSLGLSQLHSEIKGDPESVAGMIPNPGEIADTSTLTVVATTNIAEARQAGRVDVYGLSKVVEALSKLGYPKDVEAPELTPPDAEKATGEAPEESEAEESVDE